MTQPQLLQIDEALNQQFGATVNLPTIACPYTTVVNRANVVNMANDLLPRFGIQRLPIQSLQEISGEFGPSNQQVWRALNDSMNQIRFVGGGWYASEIQSAGVAALSQSQNDYVEVTFYGTGLNLLTIFDSSARAFSYAVDGGTPTALTVPTVTSSPITGKNYNPNQVLALASGLTLGMHTVKLQNTSSSFNMWVSGFEILNTNSTLQYPTGSAFLGSKKISKIASSTDPYNSNFASGTLSTTYGGHVAIYMTSAGATAKSIQSNTAGPLYLTNANHTNESIVRSYTPMEFGAGTSTDYNGSNASVGVAKYFTLDDGSTTMQSSDWLIGSFNNMQALDCQANGDYLIFTFVGTGLDVLMSQSSNGGADTYNIQVDGGSTQAIATTGSTAWKTVPIVSGLAYGTHTVQFNRVTASTYNILIARFDVYAPSMPSIPTGAILLSDYYVMGGFVVNAVSPTNTNIGGISQGILRKVCTREMTYNGTLWTSSGTTTNDIGGIEIYTTATSTDFMTYTFFGTGFDLRCSNNATACVSVMSIDGSSNFTVANASPATGAGWTAALTTSFYGAGLVSFVASTGFITTTTTVTSSNGLTVQGLTLGLHTVKVLKNSGAGVLTFQAFDLITPIHSPKSNLPGDLQNMLTVGSNALGDQRLFAGSQVNVLKNWAQAFGVTSSPTTTSTTLIPCPDMICTIKTTGNPIEIFYTNEWYASINNASGFGQIYVDGVAVGQEKSPYQTGGGYNTETFDSIIVPVAAGTHTVQLYWAISSAGTLTAVATRRNLKVREIS